ncbi:MAG: hypothetical protein ACI9JN_002471 [Bacteroidia bacterium]|jgi:hypothetical protein
MNIGLKNVNTIQATTFEIHSFRAVDRPDLCKEYLEGHINVLQDYGVTSVKSSNPTWTKNPNAICIVAMRDNKMMGGIRIHKADGVHLLPMEEGVSKIDPSVSKEITDHTESGCGEQCGLWNSKTIRGYGISWILVNASIALLPQLGLRKLYGLASDYSMFLFSPAGFEIQKQFGDKGDFNYPTEKYIARVVMIGDCIDLPTTGKDEQAFINLLRDDTTLKRKIVVNQLKLNLSFDLNIES